MLPMGSIVYLKEGTQKIMIIGRGMIIENDGAKMLLDYGGVKYPQSLDEEGPLYFNEENIDRVIHEGYCDEEEVRFNEVYPSLIQQLDDNIKRKKISRGPRYLE